ncbi:hypothetical protein SERLA73DRAFT_175325 [Serpula lacrymans var. lacrymans S7.3]|uniref:Uncharacterized protein n=2 Tax=Serpula lacrymans var. lacrymans TaxID=341189 RepID=F8PJ98_SERL3|nr:uncharacterized protein SERLADRAFT_457532 [Serpula lacrymans var. lacrymans S7.9]EGO03723.1 hypothetical protein SERLA73DRAFT_175325 [Serpula lacrymans var. lacrymans S7.3]EGO29587.1 hypothetical protein SERLADRAFT_457532 [Serpula lacrymans var. lacrymans S7.9]
MPLLGKKRDQNSPTTNDQIQDRGAVPSSNPNLARTTGGNTLPGQNPYQSASGGDNMNVGTNQLGPGRTSASGAGGAQGIPPTDMLNANQGSGGGGGSHAFTGRVEHAVGSMIGSNALKAKGMQKQQEANSINLQGQELAEAERLEREALMRRERAVAHGAHPDNKHLGSNPNASALQDYGTGQEQGGRGVGGYNQGTGGYGRQSGQ